MTRKFICGCGHEWQKAFKPFPVIECPNCGSAAQVREVVLSGNIKPIEYRIDLEALCHETN